MATEELLAPCWRGSLRLSRCSKTRHWLNMIPPRRHFPQQVVFIDWPVVAYSRRSRRLPDQDLNRISLRSRPWNAATIALLSFDGRSHSTKSTAASGGSLRCSCSAVRLARAVRSPGSGSPSVPHRKRGRKGTSVERARDGGQVLVVRWAATAPECRRANRLRAAA